MPWKLARWHNEWVTVNASSIKQLCTCYCQKHSAYSFVEREAAINYSQGHWKKFFFSFWLLPINSFLSIPRYLVKDRKFTCRVLIFSWGYLNEHPCFWLFLSFSLSFSFSQKKHLLYEVPSLQKWTAICYMTHLDFAWKQQSNTRKENQYVKCLESRLRLTMDALKPAGQHSDGWTWKVTNSRMIPLRYFEIYISFDF